MIKIIKGIGTVCNMGGGVCEGKAQEAVGHPGQGADACWPGLPDMLALEQTPEEAEEWALLAPREGMPGKGNMCKGPAAVWLKPRERGGKGRQGRQRVRRSV